MAALLSLSYPLCSFQAKKKNPMFSGAWDWTPVTVLSSSQHIIDTANTIRIIISQNQSNHMHCRQAQFASKLHHGYSGKCDVDTPYHMWKKAALSSKWLKKSELSTQWLATTPQTMHACCEAITKTAYIPPTLQLGLMAFSAVFFLHLHPVGGSRKDPCRALSTQWLTTAQTVHAYCGAITWSAHPSLHHMTESSMVLHHSQRTGFVLFHAEAEDSQ